MLYSVARKKTGAMAIYILFYPLVLDNCFYYFRIKDSWR
jgi:hypothetical protein